MTKFIHTGDLESVNSMGTKKYMSKAFSYRWDVGHVQTRQILPLVSNIMTVIALRLVGDDLG